jgi:anti-sigma regulatory factor (Ser/Thr protein kinase)
LLRALRARAADHPESPGLIASWPGVPANQMAAACAALRQQGHQVNEVAIIGPRNGKVQRAWALEQSNGGEPVPAPPARLAKELAVLVHVTAEPSAVPLVRAALARVAEREGVPAHVSSAIALAVTEACTHVVLHAYVDAQAPGDLRVRAGKAHGNLIVEVADDGRGLVAHVDGPGLGLGLPLIAQMTDVLEIRTDRARPGLVLRMHFGVDRADRAPRPANVLS